MLEPRNKVTSLRLLNPLRKVSPCGNSWTPITPYSDRAAFRRKAQYLRAEHPLLLSLRASEASPEAIYLLLSASPIP
jgi:hypothetical protein